MNTNDSRPASLAAAHASTPVISIFATFPTEPEWEHRHERCKTRKEAADCIRDARAKGGFNINVFDPWTKKREPYNDGTQRPE